MRSRLVRCLSTAALALVGVGASAPIAHAQTTYTSLASWLAAVSSASWTVDFNSYSVDQEFRTTAVDVGPFSLLQSGSANISANTIDATPFSVGSVDGTTHAYMFTNFGVISVNLIPDAPLSAWGAEFSGASSGERLQLKLFGTGDELLTSLSVPDLGFFGFTMDAGKAITRISFESTNEIVGAVGEGFRMDNVVGVNAAAVPEPNTLALLAVGVGAAAVARRRRAHKA